MIPDDKAALRDLRDATTDEEDKKLLRRTINHIQSLEGRLSTVRTLLRTALNEASPKSRNEE